VIQLFGVRHLSPMGAAQLARWIDACEPTAVLIEGPSDANGMIPFLASESCRPPVAILSFTEARPARSVLIPLAEYSPEWVALRGGLARGAVVRFMDLPAEVTLAARAARDMSETEGAGRENPTEDPALGWGILADPWTALAERAGDPDPDTWWERTFEHNAEPDAYRAAVRAFGGQLREIESESPARRRETLLREAFMRRVIRDTIAEGHAPERIVVVCGAYHCEALVTDAPALDDGALAALPRASCRHTVMPYSFERLSSQSGYGAGNHAPAYFQLLYECAREGDVRRAAPRLLARLADALRQRGHRASSAEVIEATRLARAIASLHGDASAPTLRDLLDAALACMCRGETGKLESVRAAVCVGVERGAAPTGVPRTLIQEDFDVNLRALRLTEHRVSDERPVRGRAQHGGRPALDLREDRRARTEHTALRDRAVSIFLHRTVTLGLGFAALMDAEDDEDSATDEAASSRIAHRGSFKEVWVAGWSPDVEMALIEQGALGDSIAQATERTLARGLDRCATVAEATAIADAAMRCELQSVLDRAVDRARELAVEDDGFASVASAARDLRNLTQYGSVRRARLASLEPLIGQLALRGALLLPHATRVDDEGAVAIARGMSDLQWVARSTPIDADERAHDEERMALRERWWSALHAVADGDDANPYCAGVADALLLEAGCLSDERVDVRVSRRTTPGPSPDTVARYVEGLCSRNRVALLSRASLWRSLSRFVESLEDPQFERCLPGLRRAFSAFDTGQIRRLTEGLVSLWDSAPDEARALRAIADTRLDPEALEALSEGLGGLADLDL
jgi:hypothetical protein